MYRKFTLTASLITAASLAGCAALGASHFVPVARVTPGIVVAVSPANPGQDIVVKTFAHPAQMLSDVQPINHAFAAGETVGIATRHGKASVIPLPGYTGGIIVMHWPKPPKS